ncbi:heterokaryon incompatibility protein-domain-containing protein [Daldinia sp. FL1419]|nr:heterokaryon incompatibility protein-domain-containing protein [Daldinia sp. FL1419]
MTFILTGTDQPAHVDEEYRNLFTIPPLEPNTLSASSLTTAYNWLQDCCSSHRLCKLRTLSGTARYPSRLIDLGNGGDSRWKLHVVSKDGDPPESAPYMILSYRWGPNPTLQLSKSNFDELRRGNPIEDLPQTFRDFVVVARRFSIRYIWIDALCIIQDSKEDWEAEAPTMGYVYSNSVCNVAAVMSEAPDRGLSRPRDPDKLVTRRTKKQGNNFVVPRGTYLQLWLKAATYRTSSLFYM